MSTKTLHILKKYQTQIGDHISLKDLQDFDYVEGKIIEPQIIFENPNISLYCLDPQNEQAIFVETPEDINIVNAPFFFKAQYKYAKQLIAVPYEQLHQLAEKIKDSLKQLVLIYYVGRCGSTLLSKVFNQLDEVVSLSEPGIFGNQIISLREPNGSYDDRIAEILRSCTLILCKSTTAIKPSHHILKQTAFSIQLGDIMYELFPNAKVIFLYRNAEDVVRSYIRWMKNSSSSLPNREPKIEYYSRFLPLLKTYADSIDLKNSIDGYSILWLSIMQRYMELYRKGVPMCAVRYEDLIEDPQQVVKSIFQYCNLPISEVDKACRAFQNHSQSGLPFSKENNCKIQAEKSSILEIRQRVCQLLKKHPEINTSDFLVPGTLNFSDK